MENKEITICRRFKFDAAHHLPCHEGKCRNIHGHRWFVDVALSGPVHEKGPQSGMIMDFGWVKEIVNQKILNSLDHEDLNEVLEFHPTAENLSCFIFGRLELLLGLNFKEDVQKGLRVVFVRVYETEDSYAECKAINS